MIERPQNHEDALDIIWGVIRHDCMTWGNIWPNYLGCTVKTVIEETGWSQTLCYHLVYELVDLGQLTKKWNHSHQTYWSSHYHTIGENAKQTEVDIDKTGVTDLPY